MAKIERLLTEARRIATRRFKNAEDIRSMAFIQGFREGAIWAEREIRAKNELLNRIDSLINENDDNN